MRVARGCFAGAGYSVADADRFYEDVCKKAAEEFYGGKNLARSMREHTKNIG